MSDDFTWERLSQLATPALSALCGYLIYKILNPTEAPPPPKQEKKEEPVEQRKFTPEQLREFTGEDEKPIYVAIKGEVYDVSKGREFYGPEGPYSMFAGFDASRALAKMSFVKEDIENSDISELSSVELDQLGEWENKFKYWKGYPVVGRIVAPPASREFTLDELKEFNGVTTDQAAKEGEEEESSAPTTPQSGVDAPPIYVGVSGKVFDVSYGGSNFYGPGGSYHIFAGRDASRSLALMSFDPCNLENPSTESLTEEQTKVLADWLTKFEDKKKYPMVGTIVSN